MADSWDKRRDGNFTGRGGGLPAGGRGVRVVVEHERRRELLYVRNVPDYPGFHRGVLAVLHAAFRNRLRGRLRVTRTSSSKISLSLVTGGVSGAISHEMTPPDTHSANAGTGRLLAAVDDLPNAMAI